MSAQAVFASTEVAIHRMQEHFPCRGHGDTAVAYECPCEGATLWTCGHCGLCLSISVENGEMCEHSTALYEATDGMRRAARIIDGVLWVCADIEVQA